jgi:serine/threonine-protein kinase HipA
VPERATRKLLDDLASRATYWLDRLESLPFDTGMIRKLRRVVEYRRRSLAR